MYASLKAGLRDMKGVHYWKILFLTPSYLLPTSIGEEYSCSCLILQGNNGRNPAVWWCACRDGVSVVRSYLSSGIYITREEVVGRLALRAGTLSYTKPSVCCCQCWNVIWQPASGWAKLTLTVRSESRCALRLRYVDLVQACIDSRGHHFQQLFFKCTATFRKYCIRHIVEFIYLRSQ
jgi:hypothetical protein